MLRISGLIVGYEPDAPVLTDIDLHLPAAEVHAVVGPNGAGKSTLLNTIAGHCRPTAGSMLIDGRDVAGWHAVHAARAGVALAPQGRRLWGSLTVAEHLTLPRPRRIHSEGWTLEQVLNIFPALSSRLRHRGQELSGGEQQMLTIARALLTHPRLLLCDEPTEGLAPIIASQIITVLRSLPQRGITVLAALPYATTAAALADTVHILAGGRLTANTDAAPELLRAHLTLTAPPPTDSDQCTDLSQATDQR